MRMHILRVHSMPAAFADSRLMQREVIHTKRTKAGRLLPHKKHTLLHATYVSAAMLTVRQPQDTVRIGADSSIHPGNRHFAAAEQTTTSKLSQQQTADSDHTQAVFLLVVHQLQQAADTP